MISGCFGSTARDRKSTRLNSSHSQISYAVFCLKKKKHLGVIAGVCTCSGPNMQGSLVLICEVCGVADHVRFVGKVFAWTEGALAVDNPHTERVVALGCIASDQS